MVWPMKVGKITDARDHDLTTFFSLRLFISSIRPRRRASTNGPFLTERDIGFLLPCYLRCRDRTMRRPVVLDRRGREPMAGLSPGGFGGLPPGGLPPPPPRGLSRGVLTTPWTSGGWPLSPAQPALAGVWFSGVRWL